MIWIKIKKLKLITQIMLKNEEILLKFKIIKFNVNNILDITHNISFIFNLFIYSYLFIFL